MATQVQAVKADTRKADTRCTRKSDAFIHMRISSARKHRYVALAQEADVKLTQWMYSMLDAAIEAGIKVKSD